MHPRTASINDIFISYKISLPLVFLFDLDLEELNPNPLPNTPDNISPKSISSNPNEEKSPLNPEKPPYPPALPF